MKIQIQLLLLLLPSLTLGPLVVMIHSYYFYVMAIPPKCEYIQFNSHYQEKYAEHNLTEAWILQSYLCHL